MLSPPLFHNLSGSVDTAQDVKLDAKGGRGFKSYACAFGRFFFIIGEKGWAHPKVFRLPHPSMTKCLAFKKLGYRKGLK